MKIIFKAIFSFFLLTLAVPVLTQSQQEWVPFQVDTVVLDTFLKEYDVNGPQIISQEFTPYMSQGVLEGCGFSFNVLIRDWAYRSSQPTFVRGSVVYFKHSNRPNTLSLRIVLDDVENRDGTLWRKSESVNYAYLKNNENETVVGGQYVVTEGENFARSFSYIDQDLEYFDWLLASEFITVGFNREQGATDLQLNLPIMFTTAWKELAGCFREFSGI